MAELYLPIRVHVELDNSYSFTPDYRSSVGELVPQGTEQYRAIKHQIENRLAASFPSISRVELDATFSISSFDLHGIIRFSIENADLLLVHYLMLRSSLGSLLVELASAITPVFKLGWKVAMVSVGDVSKEPVAIPDDPDKGEYFRAQIFFPPGSLNEEVLGERAPGANPPRNTRPSIPKKEDEVLKRHPFVAWAIVHFVLILGAFFLAAMAVSRSDASEERILQAITSVPTAPEGRDAPINNSIAIHLPPDVQQTDALDKSCSNVQGVRIFRNGREVPCD